MEADRIARQSASGTGGRAEGDGRLSEEEVPGATLSEAIAPASELDFTEAAREELETTTLAYGSRLAKTARLCAAQSDSDLVQKRDVKKAASVLCAMGPEHDSFAEN